MPRSSRAAVLNKAKTSDPGLISSSVNAPLVTVANNRPSALKRQFDGRERPIKLDFRDRARKSAPGAKFVRWRERKVDIRRPDDNLASVPAGPAIQTAPEERLNSVNPRAAFSPRTVVVSTGDRSKRLRPSHANNTGPPTPFLSPQDRIGRSSSQDRFRELNQS